MQWCIRAAMTEKRMVMKAVEMHDDLSLDFHL